MMNIEHGAQLYRMTLLVIARFLVCQRLLLMTWKETELHMRRTPWPIDNTHVIHYQTPPAGSLGSKVSTYTVHSRDIFERLRSKAKQVGAIMPKLVSYCRSSGVACPS